MATYYVSDSTGDDEYSAAQAQSPTTPWKTTYKIVSEVNAGLLNPGDSVLFKRGDYWQNQNLLFAGGSLTGTSSARITLGAYGSGAKPKFSMSLSRDSTGDWTETSSGSHVWWTTCGSTYDVGMVVFNRDGTAIVGNKHFSSSTLAALTPKLPLTAQGDYYWHEDGTTFTLGSYSSSAERLYVYSTSNPATYYPNGIECCRDDYGMFVRSNNYVTVQDLYFCYNSSFGAALLGGGTSLSNSTGQIMERIDFYMIGGSPYRTGTGYGEYGGARDGYAIQFDRFGADCHVRDCTFEEIWDRSISAQASLSDGVQHFNGVYIYRNVAKKGAPFFEVSMQFSDANTANAIMVVNNTTYYSNEGPMNVEKRAIGRLLNSNDMLYYHYGGEEGSYTNCVCKNNIFNYSTAQDGRYQSLQTHNAPDYWNLHGWDIDYNCYRPDGYFVDNGTYLTLAQWRARGCVVSPGPPDTNSFVADPLFTDATHGDFTLTVNSPCVYKGTYISGISQHNPPSMGAYEYEAAPPPSSGNTYYVKNGGNDNLDGKSDYAAWATLAKVNSFSFAPGDSCLFKRGGIWREYVGLHKQSVGSAGSPVTFGAYGSGANPVISHGQDLSSSSLWSNTGMPTNVWKATITSNAIEVGQLLLNWNGTVSAGDYTDIGGFIMPGSTATSIIMDTRNEKLSTTSGAYDGCHLYIWDGANEGQHRTISTYTYSGGVATATVESSSVTWNTSGTSSNDVYLLHTTSTKLLTTDGQYCFDPPNHLVYLYCSHGNPGTYYNGIMACLDGISSYVNRNQTGYYATVQDIDFAHYGGGDTMIQVGSHTLFERCGFYWWGGAYAKWTFARDGYAFMLFTSVSDVTVRDCIIDEGYNKVFSHQYGNQDNIKLYRNIICRCHGVAELWPQAGTYTNIYWVNNTGYEFGGGVIGSQQKLETGSVPVGFYWKGQTLNGIYIYNNIAYCTADTAARFISHNEGDTTPFLTNIVSDYNCWYPDHTSYPAYKWNNTTLPYTLAQWQATTGSPDQHSIASDPKFVDAVNGDFRLSSTSPCILTGIYISGISTANPPNMGAYETQEESPPPVAKLCPFRKA